MAKDRSNKHKSDDNDRVLNAQLALITHQTNIDVERNENNSIVHFNGDSNMINNGEEDDEFINELLATINDEIRDISATCLKDLTTISTIDHALTDVI